MKERSYSTKCTLIVPDTHFQAPLGNTGRMIAPVYCHDPVALSVVLQIQKQRKPDEIVHLGDICEMAVLSEWNRVQQREGQVKGEDGQWYFSAWDDIMKQVDAYWAFNEKTCPSAEKHQLEGNHDFWAEIVFSQPMFAPFAKMLHIRNRPVWRELKIDYREYNGDQRTEPPWVDVGNVRCVHGYKNVSAARMLREHDNVIYGHQHKILFTSWDANSREQRGAWSCGCLTKLKPEYNSRGGQQNGWSHAFGVIYTLPDGKQWVQVIKIIDGVTVFEGQTYRATELTRIDKGLRPLELAA